MTDCKMNVLLIEDDELIRETIQGILESEGYEVFSAANGQEGLEIFGTMPSPCIILLDLFMPVMTGIEFLKALGPSAMSLPIVALSAAPPDGEAVQEIKPFLKGFMKKPIDLYNLLSTVKSFCEEA